MRNEISLALNWKVHRIEIIASHREPYKCSARQMKYNHIFRSFLAIIISFRNHSVNAHSEVSTNGAKLDAASMGARIQTCFTALMQMKAFIESTPLRSARDSHRLEYQQSHSMTHHRFDHFIALTAWHRRHMIRGEAVPTFLKYYI